MSKDGNFVLEGAKTLARGTKIIYKDIVQPGYRTGKKVLGKRKKKEPRIDTGF